ncbi:MAG TPA: hypothetical protein VN660_06065 [Steroidobacteraceae bacterium]|nr:hypothetical protein [Steroidobacteraceae bacterium]
MLNKFSNFCAVLFAGVGAVLLSMPASAQDTHQSLDGFWNALYDEDQPERIPGPDQGDYAGLPITAAAASVAQTWDPEVLTIPYLQCRPHPALYGIRGVGQLRIWEQLDQQTLQQVAIHTWIVAWESQRDIWMDGRPHPPPWAAHSWAGFSTGRWVGDDLYVHTDMFKRGWTRRNGLPTSDRATFDERMFRDGDILTDVTMITDPQYLSEPLVKSTEYQKADETNFVTYPCREVTEIPRHEGDIPMHLPNQTAVEQDYPARNGVPLKASRGGAQTLFPEYQDDIVKLPPNPPIKQVERQEQQQDSADAKL